MCKEKQIEEMRRDLIVVGNGDGTINFQKTAEYLYIRGFRKQSEDTVEVVRCKDCIHYLPYQKPVEFDGRCTACRGDTDEDEFCSRGVRREQK